MAEASSSHHGSAVEADGPARATPSLAAFVVLIDLAAVVVLLTLPADGLQDRAGAAAAFVVLALAAGATRVRIPVLRTHLAAVDPLVFCALATIGPSAACLTAVAAVVGTLLAPGKKPAVRQLAFNFGAVTLATAAASLAFHVAGGQPGASPPGALLPVTAGLVLFFLVNAVLLGTVIDLDRRALPSPTSWRRLFLCTLPASGASLLVVTAMLAVAQWGLGWSLLVALPACGLIVAFTRNQAQRLNPEH